MIRRAAIVLILFGVSPLPALAQTDDTRPPVIDVHMHAPIQPGEIEEFVPALQSRLESMDSLNVRYAVYNGVPDVLFALTPLIEQRIGGAIPALMFPCLDGLVVMRGRPCFEDGGNWPDIDQLQDDIESGRVEALGEITTQFLGLEPSAPELEPYLALAEEHDIPVFIHMGPGFPGTNTGGRYGDLPVPNYRATAGNPLTLEESLIRHPRLRVAVMHAGWPLADEMVSMLHQFPQLYAEVGILQWTELFPRVEYYSFLKRLVDAGFSDRILFGSDASLSEGIDAILDADFLTEQQKRDILCNNAARFLRLDEDVCTEEVGSAPEQDGAAERLAYEIHGEGEEILFIHGSFMEDALRPIIDEAALRDHRRIHYDRAGYGESAPRDGAFSFESGAADALDLIRQLDLGSVHVVGYSLGGVIALQLARSNPEVVKSLVLIEPPLPLVGIAEGPPPQFLIDGVGLWEAGDHEGATDVFFRTIASPTWRADIARGLPEGPEQVSQNAHLFFEEELPGFQGYLVGEADVADLDLPILYIVSENETGYGTGHIDRLELTRTWLPQTEPLTVPDADHALPMQRPEIIADAIASFVERHIGGSTRK